MATAPGPRLAALAPVVACVFALFLAAPPQAVDASVRTRAVDSMLKGVNQVRARHGLAPLRRSPSLQRSAGSYSRHLMRTDRFGHSGMSRARGFRRKGEALELHTGHRPNARGALRNLMNSPAHRRLILSSHMRQVGAGLTRGRFGRSRATIWVLHVGRR